MGSRLQIDWTDIGDKDSNGNVIVSQGVPAFRVTASTYFTKPETCDEIGFVQIARLTGINGLLLVEGRPGVAGRTTPSGWYIDRGNSDRLNAWFTMNDDGSWGVNYFPEEQLDKKGKIPGIQTGIVDRPASGKLVNTKWEFETFAICKKGPDKGKVYGGFHWGFEVDQKGVVTPLEPQQIGITPSLREAVDAWNKQAAGTKQNRIDFITF